MRVSVSHHWLDRCAKTLNKKADRSLAKIGQAPGGKGGINGTRGWLLNKVWLWSRNILKNSLKKHSKKCSKDIYGDNSVLSKHP